MSNRFSDPFDPMIEPSHYPHMERFLAPLTIVNQNEQTVWHPRRTHLSLVTQEGAGDEGGTFRDPPPARVPRHTPIFKSDSQMRDEGWHATSTTPLVICFCVTLAAWALLIWAAL